MKTQLLAFVACFIVQVSLVAQSLPEETRHTWAEATEARDLGQYDLALALFGIIIDAVPNNAELYNSRGKTYFDMAVSWQYGPVMDSLLQLSIDDYDAGLRCTPLLATVESEILVNRGAVLGVRGQMEAAILDFSAGILLDEQNKNGYLNRAIAYQNLSEYEKAVDDLSHYLELNPVDPNIYYERGMLYRVLNNSQKALEDLNRSISLDPNLGIAYLERARAYAQSGDKVAAQLDYERAAQFNIKMEASDLIMMKRQ